MANSFEWLTNISGIWFQWNQTVFLQGLATLAILLLAIRWMRTWPARWRYLCWAIVLVKFVIPWPLGIELPLLPSNTSAITEMKGAYAPIITDADLMEPVVGFEENTPISLGETATVTAFEKGEDSSGFTFGWFEALFLLWGMGLIAFGARTAWQVRNVYSIKRAPTQDDKLIHATQEISKELGLSRSIPVLVTEESHSPMVVGFFRPVILLSHETAALDLPRLRMLLCHELAHIRRRDHQLNWLWVVITILAWWNPIVWYLHTRVNEESERSCDDLVLQRYPGDKREYSRLLLDVAEMTVNQQYSYAAVAFTESKNGLGRRLKRILSKSGLISPLSARAYIALGLIVSLMLPVWSVISQTNAEETYAAVQEDATPYQVTTDSGKTQQNLNALGYAKTVASTAAGSIKQLEVQRSIENALQQKLEKALGRLIGPDNYNVTVNAKLDWKKSPIKNITIDKVNKAPISTKEYSETSAQKGVTGAPGVSSTVQDEGIGSESNVNNTEITEEVTNYVHPWFETIAEDSGAKIKEIAIAVLLNYKESEEGERIPFSADELNILKSMLRVTIGLPAKETQGDPHQFVLQCVLFEQPKKQQPSRVQVIKTPKKNTTLDKKIDGPVEAQDIELSLMLNLLKDQCGLQYVLDEGVSKKVTFSLDNPTARDVLDMVLPSYGLSYEEIKPGVVRIREVKQPKTIGMSEVSNTTDLSSSVEEKTPENYILDGKGNVSKTKVFPYLTTPGNFFFESKGTIHPASGVQSTTDYIKHFKDAIDAAYTPKSEDIVITETIGQEWSMRVLKNSVYGVGIIADWDTERDLGILVVSPIPGTPAEKEGIQSGDIIIAVNGESLEDWEGEYQDKLAKAVNKIRGEKDTSVTLTILRKSDSELIDITLKRAPQPIIQQIRSEMLNDEIGYLKIRSFDEKSAENIRKALLKLRADGMKKLILDFQCNMGGLLEEAIKTADLFLPKGKAIAYIDSPRKDFVSKTDGERWLFKTPIVVLINNLSGNAVGMLANALKEHRNALLIGTKSLCQNDPDTRLFTPAGHDINENGISPDIEAGIFTSEELKKIQNKNYSGLSRRERLLDIFPPLRKAFEYLEGKEITE